MVLIAGFEPAASDLPSQRSSPDLYQHVMEGGIGFEPMYDGIKIRGLRPDLANPQLKFL